MLRLSTACIFLLANLLANLSMSAFADEPFEEPYRGPLFLCATGPTGIEGVLELTGVADDVGVYSALQFHAETPGERPVLFPDVPGPGKGNFFFSNTDCPDGYLVSIRFTKGDVKYRFFSLSIPPGPSDDGIYGGGGGLVITEADGNERVIDCQESVYGFIDYMHDAMSCDADPRYGA